MDAQELRALLEVAARELGAMAAQLPKDNSIDGVDLLFNEILEAQDAVDDAANCCADFHVACESPGDVLQEARALRAEAVRSRDLAESHLWTLQDEHAQLLNRLHNLSSEQQHRLEEQHNEADVAAAREATLVERCAQLDNEVRSLREDVDAKSQRLIASTALGHSLELNKRKVQRQHEGSLVENAIAREILHLQQSTEAYLQQVSVECSNYDQSLEVAQKQCADKMEALQSEWSEQQARYHNDMNALQTRFADLQQQYADRWKSNETSAREKLDNKLLQAAESRRKVEEQLVALDEDWEKEADASRKLVEEQNRIMSDARQVVITEMEEKLEARQQEMEKTVDTERRRCEAVRRRHLEKVEDSQGDIALYKQRIEELSSNYRRRHTRTQQGCRVDSYLRLAPSPYSTCRE